MADIGMGANLPNQLQNLNKAKENEKTDKTEKGDKVDKRDGIREALAGSKQVEEKQKKEDVPKTEERFKAYQKAARYMLGNSEDEDIDDAMASAQVDEMDETEEVQEPE